MLLSTAASAVNAGTEELVLRLLYQLVAILVTSRIVVRLVRYTGQTDVSGEILAGLVLGPSLLGAIAPGLMQALFHPSTSSVFTGIAQVGLILLMFQIGLEFEFKAAFAENPGGIAAISIAGIVAPFALGYATAPWFHAQLAEPRPELVPFRLFFAVAMSITAIPILGRIMLELGLSHTRTAATTIGAAAIDDVIGWLLLGVVSLIASQSFTLGWIGWRLLGLAIYVAIVFLVARPLLKRAIRAHLERHDQLATSGVALMLIALFVSAAITSNLGVFAIIGGFAIGAALHDERRLVAEWRLRVTPLVNSFFLPLFFAYTGLRTDIGTLDSLRELWICALVMAVAFVGKFGGAYAASRAIGEPHRRALTIATCMNTRALMELVALNIGYDLGVLPRSMFTKLVIMAIVSTFMATPLIRWLMRDERRPAAAA